MRNATPYRAYQDAVNAGVITQGNHLLTLPTGAGKTHLAQQAAQHEVQKGNTVLVLTPTKALAAQTAADHQTALGPGVRVQAYTRDTRGASAYRNTDVIVTTPERLDFLTRTWRRHHHWLARVGLLTVDEAHLLGDPERGAHLDAAVTRFRLINPLARVIAMTATCGNPEDLSAWLRARHTHSDERPIPLRWTATTAPHAAAHRKALLSALDTRHTLIFVHSRRKADELARDLRAAGHAAQPHHAGLTPEQRQDTEARLQRGDTRVVVATPTLEVGVNFPVEHVILHDLRFHDREKGRKRRTPLSVNAAWQRAGRAGRVPGMTVADVTVIGNSQEDPGRFEHGPKEALVSPLSDERHMQLFLLGSIDAGMATTPAQCLRLAGRTLAGQQQGQAGAHERALAALTDLGALTSERGHLKLTPLGRVASRHLLRVQDVAFCRHLPEDPTAYDVLLLLASRFAPVHASEAAGLIIEATHQQVPSRTLDDGLLLHPEQATGAHVAWHACINGDESSAEAHGLYTTDVTALRAAYARLAQAWADLHPEQLKLRLTSVMLTGGLPLEHATLTMLPGIGHARARALAHAGFTDAEAVAASLPEDLLAAGFSLKTAAHTVERAEQLVATFTEDVTREPPPRPGRTPFPLDLRGPVDPLRLSRALTLHAEPLGDRIRRASPSL